MRQSATRITSRPMITDLKINFHFYHHRSAIKNNKHLMGRVDARAKEMEVVEARRYRVRQADSPIIMRGVCRMRINNDTGQPQSILDLLKCIGSH